MALGKADDFPIHQTSDPIAYAGTDRNFYDRYFFNGWSPDQQTFFAAAFGVYPQLNIADASFCLVRDGVQANLHASRWLMGERLDLAVGPIAIEIVEPLQRLKLKVSSPEHGIAADLSFTGRAFPIEEPRFIRRIGPRAVMDYTRLTQNGRWEGRIEADGKAIDAGGWVGVRDRSWGVRPVGARDPQEAVPPAAPQFFWIWGPTNMADGSFFFHTNDDAAGEAWNRRAVWAPDGAAPDGFFEFPQARFAAEWKSDARHVRRAVVTLEHPRAGREVIYEPLSEFLMVGLGYGHERWGHGLAHGQLAVEREDFDLARLDWRLPRHLHVQALCKVTDRPNDGPESVGQGILEQLAIGPHAPSGFKELLDLAS